MDQSAQGGVSSSSDAARLKSVKSADSALSLSAEIVLEAQKANIHVPLIPNHPIFMSNAQRLSAGSVMPKGNEMSSHSTFCTLNSPAAGGGKRDESHDFCEDNCLVSDSPTAVLAHPPKPDLSMLVANQQQNNFVHQTVDTVSPILFVPAEQSESQSGILHTGTTGNFIRHTEQRLTRIDAVEEASGSGVSFGHSNYGPHPSGPHSGLSTDYGPHSSGPHSGHSSGMQYIHNTIGTWRDKPREWEHASLKERESERDIYRKPIQSHKSSLHDSQPVESEFCEMEMPQESGVDFPFEEDLYGFSGFDEP